MTTVVRRRSAIGYRFDCPGPDSKRSLTLVLELEVVDVQPLSEFPSYLRKTGHLLESECAVQADAGFVGHGDAGHQAVQSLRAAGFEEGRQQPASAALAMVVRTDINGGFGREAVGFFFFPAVGIAIAGNAAVGFFHEVGVAGSNRFDALAHFRFTDGFRLERDGGMLNVVVVDGCNGSGTMTVS